MIIRQTTQFKKDLKRYQHDEGKIADLAHVIRSLRDTGVVPEEYYPHKLTGNYKGFMECHVQSDFLLIWFEEGTDTAWLSRLGSHSELFRK